MISRRAVSVGSLGGPFSRLSWRWLPIAFVLALPLAVLLGAGQAHAANLPSNCTQSGTTVTCTFSPGPEGTFAVPAGVASVHVVATGQGGGTPNPPGSVVGGPGAQVTADLGVRAGSTLFVEVAIGGGASTSTIGGRGGGESDVRTCSITDASCPAVGTAQDPRLIVAGGGGGGGCCGFGGDGGAGGVGTNTCNPGTDGMDSTDQFPGRGGKGGGCTSGGAGGSGFGPGGDGTASSGGPSFAFGGGGGAGFFGGGGGGSNSIGESGGGGGGSSFGPTGSVFATATTGPQVVITYTARPAVVLTVQADCTQSGKFCFDFSATTTDIPAAGRNVVVTVFGIQQNGEAQALGGGQNVHFGENVVDHTFAFCFPVPAGVTFTRFQVQVKPVESDLSVTLNGSSDLHLIPPSAGGGVAVLASLDNTCATPATPTPTATPSAMAVAQTGGFDFRLPLIGLAVIVAGLALYLVSAARGRPSTGR